MNKKEKSIIIYAISALFLLSIFLYKGAAKISKIAAAKNAKIERSTLSPDELKYLQKITGSLHSQINEFVCWGKSGSKKNIPWSKICGDTGYAIKAAALINQNISEIRNPKLRQDYKEFLLLLNEAENKKDPKLLIYAHRIIHDIDYWILNSDSEKSRSQDYWKATLTLEGPRSSFQSKLKKLNLHP